MRSFCALACLLHACTKPVVEDSRGHDEGDAPIEAPLRGLAPIEAPLRGLAPGASLFLATPRFWPPNCLGLNDALPQSGTFVRCWPNGNVAERGATRGGRLHGEIERFFPRGGSIERGGYAGGVPVGRWVNEIGEFDQPTSWVSQDPAGLYPDMCGNNATSFPHTPPASAIRQRIGTHRRFLRRTLRVAALAQDEDAVVRLLEHTVRANSLDAHDELQRFAGEILEALLERGEECVRSSERPEIDCPAAGIALRLLPYLGQAGDATHADLVLRWLEKGGHDWAYFRDLAEARPDVRTEYGSKLLEAYRRAEGRSVALFHAMTSMISLRELEREPETWGATTLRVREEVEAVEGRGERYANLTYWLAMRLLARGAEERARRELVNALAIQEGNFPGERTTLACLAPLSERMGDANASEYAARLASLMEIRSAPPECCRERCEPGEG
ncbi:MAG: hypothetical protein AAGE52_36135 [Myxococcota bacterium]